MWSFTRPVICGVRMRSGGLGDDSTSGASWVMTANGSSRIFHVTFGYCLVNSLVSSTVPGKPVSKYPCRVTGLVPQLAAKLAGLAAAAAGGAAGGLVAKAAASRVAMAGQPGAGTGRAAGWRRQLGQALSPRSVLPS